MNPQISLYSFTRDAYVIATGRIANVTPSDGDRPGVQNLRIDVEITEVLWGGAFPDRRSFTAELPQSPAARIKFPDPVWGRVNVRSGATILLVVKREDRTDIPVYAEEYSDPNDPVLREIRELLTAEADGNVPSANRVGRHLAWLESASQLRKLYAGEILAREDVAAAEHRGRVIPAYLKAFANEQDVYIKLNLGSWLWDHIWPRADEIDRVRIVNATLRSASSSNASVRDFSLDRLSEADPGVYRARGIQRSPETARMLEDRKSKETDAGARKQLDDIIAAITQ